MIVILSVPSAGSSLPPVLSRSCPRPFNDQDCDPNTDLEHGRDRQGRRLCHDHLGHDRHDQCGLIMVFFGFGPSLIRYMG